MGGAGSKRKLTKEDLDFLISNTNFTKQQIKQWYHGFMVGRLNICLVVSVYMVEPELESVYYCIGLLAGSPRLWACPDNVTSESPFPR